MVVHTKMNAKRIRSMTEAGLRAPYLSGLAESTYLEARILLLRFELPAEPVVPPRPGVPTDKAVRELQIERVKNLAIVLSQQSERLGRTFEDYDSQLANLLATQRRVMEARIELSDTAEDKFLQLKRLIEAAKAMEANIDLHSNAGVGAPSRVNRARSHRLEAEIELLRFQTGRELTPMRDPNPKPAGGIDPATIEPTKLIAQLLRDGRKNDNVAELLKALFRELMVVRRQTDTRLGAEKEDFYSQLIEITGTTERLLRTGLELCESAEQAIALRMHVLNMAIDIETRVKRRTDAGIGDSYAYNLARSFRLDQEIRLLQATAELDQGSNLNAVVPCQATPCPCVAPIASPKVGPIRRLVARLRSP